jgi:hypothetical protein
MDVCGEYLRESAFWDSHSDGGDGLEQLGGGKIIRESGEKFWASQKIHTH